MQQPWWRDPDHRRDVLIVVGLFGLGLLFNVLVGVVVVVVFDLFGLWGTPPVEVVLSANSVEVTAGYAGADT